MRCQTNREVFQPQWHCVLSRGLFQVRFYNSNLIKFSRNRTIIIVNTELKLIRLKGNSVQNVADAEMEYRQLKRCEELIITSII